jgi:H+/Cl- antiporter ClcA
MTQRGRFLTLIRLVLYGAVIGIPAALASLAFFTAVHYLEDFLWTDLPKMLGQDDLPAYLILGLPVVGALIVAAARIGLPGDGGHNPLEGMARGMTAVRHVPGVVLAALGTLGFGLVLGPEAPVMAIGSATGVAMSNLIRVGQKETAILSGAGQFSAISTLFGGPLVGGVMVTEASIGLGAALVPALLPGFVAAAVGYLIFVGLGPYTGAPAPGLTVPDLEPFVGITVVDLIVAIGIGIAAAVVLALVNQIARGLGMAGPARLGTGPRGITIFLVSGGLAVGSLALIAQALGVNPRDVLFSGQSSIPNLVSLTSVSALVILLLAKALAYIVSLASGFRGGPIFPALFLGIGVAAFAVELGGLNPTLAIAVGAAAGMAAQTRLVLTSMLFAALLVGSAGADAITAVVLATVAAYLTSIALDPPKTAASDQAVPSGA